MADGEPVCRFLLPAPPSTNNLHGSHIDKKSGKLRRHNTAAYRLWIKDAGWAMKEQQSPLPAFPDHVRILIEGVERIDVDNIKAIPDLLKRMGVIADDKLIDRLEIDRCGWLVAGKVMVSIWPM